MFCPLEYKDALIIFRGLCVLIITVLLGVSAAQGQLSKLTQNQEYVPNFSITYDQSGLYSIYILGSSYTMRAAYSVGEIINNDREVIVRIDHHNITIPRYIDIDCKQELILLDLWAKVLVEEVFQLKHTFDTLMNSVHQRMLDYIEHSR